MNTIPPHCIDTESNTFNKFLSDAGASDLLDHLQEIVKAVQAGHELFERDARAHVLKIDIGSINEKNAEVLMDTARRHGNMAEHLMRAWAQSDIIARAQTEGLDSPDGDSIRERLVNAREYMAQTLLEKSLSAAQAGERMNMFDMALERVQKDGLSATLSFAADQIAKLSWCLTESENWGRKPHSPIPWWAWVGIIALIILGVALTVICAITSGCSWMTAIIGVAATVA